MKRPEFNAAWDPEVQELYRNDLRYYWDRSLEPQVITTPNAALPGLGRRLAYQLVVTGTKT